MAGQTHKESYDRDGYVVIPEFLSAQELAELKVNLDRYVSDVVPHRPDTDAFYQDRSQPETLRQMHRMECDPWFAEYSQHPRWLELGRTLTGEEGGSQSIEWFNKPPGTTHITPPHQDNYYFCLVPSNVVTIWLALDPVDTENGCLRYVKASHLNGFRKHARSKVLGFSQGITDYSPDDFGNEIAIPLHPGDVVAHHGMTIHRADANISRTRHRRSLAMVFKGVSCQRDASAFDLYQASAQELFEEVKQ